MTIDLPEQSPEDSYSRQQMAELVVFIGTCKDLISFEELMELRERDLSRDSAIHESTRENFA